jgi:uncharacterized protein (DUF1800 family)
MVSRILILVCLISLAACGGGGGGGGSSPSTPASGSGGTNPPVTSTPEPDPAFYELVRDEAALDGARFLTQASFGVSEDSLMSLRADGYDYEAWITDQIAAPQSEVLVGLDDRMRAAGLNPLDKSNLELDWYKRNLLSDVLWESFVYGEDQLRQRMAFALSQIFVISDISDALFNDTRGIANYHDVLARNALGNYRDLLEEVTLNPMMGEYLSMVRNEKADPARNIRPDENYAREMMQLFTIGLVMLNNDGSVQKDEQGQAIPTYDQETIKAFARVFTGWMYGDAPQWYWWEWKTSSEVRPMKPFEEFHDTAPKTLLNGQIVPEGQSARDDLEAALGNVFNHSNVAPFVSKQLIQRLVTSNPSPAYVSRVSAVFNDNGSGVKGDLAAVARAILLDPEARAKPDASAYFGKLKAPLLKFTALMRAFDVAAYQPLNAEGSASRQTIRFFWPGFDYAQRPYGAPSVFNFYRPDYQPANTFADTSVVAPEFQILDEKNITAASNWAGAIIFNAYDFLREGCEDNLTFDNGVGCLYPDFQYEIELAKDTGQLLDHLDMLLMAGQMSSEAKAIVAEHIDTFDSVAEQERLYRVAEAVYLLWMSPEYAIQR